MASVFDNTALFVARNVQRQKPNAVVDITTLIPIIVDVMREVIILYKNCKKSPSDAQKNIRSVVDGGLLGWFSRRRLMRIILGAASNKLQAGISYDEIYNALLLYGSMVDVNEVRELYEAV